MKSNKGFTLIELLIVVAIIGIIAAIAIPGLMRARAAGNEASAIGSMRAINSAQATYAASCGHGFYVAALTDLKVLPAEGTSFLGDDLTTDDSVVKSTYTISMANGGAAASGVASCNDANTFVDYAATAVPLQVGTRSFNTNSSGTIFDTDSGLPIQ